MTIVIMKLPKLNIGRWIAVLGVFSIVAVLLSAILAPSSAHPVPSDGAALLNSGWEYEGNQIKLPINLKTQKDVPVTIRRSLAGQMVPDGWLCFRSIQQTVEVRLDGELIYSYDGESYFFRSAPLSSWHFVNIPQGSKGALEMTFNSPFNAYSGNLGGMLYGTKSAEIFSIFQEYGLDLLLCALSFCIGLCLLAAHLLSSRRRYSSKDLLYLGLFSLGVSVWCATETRLLQFLGVNLLTELMAGFFSLLLCPLPFLLLMCQKLRHREQRIVRGICVLYLLNFGVCAVLQATGLADFVETVSGFIVMTIICLPVLIYFFLFRNSSLQGREKLAHALALLVLLGGTVLDALTYTFQAFGHIGYYTRVGLFLYVLMLALLALDDNSKRIESVGTLQKLATYDPLTGVLNKSALEAAVNTCLQNGNVAPCALMVIDIDHFKEVNDRLGHLTGDQVLSEAGKCIKGLFRSQDLTGRVGGDEFVALLSGIGDKEVVCERACQLCQCIRELNGGGVKVTASIGVAMYPRDGQDYRALFAKADGALYEAKRAGRDRFCMTDCEQL